jgi:DNA-binding transcriptional LysR family regulator
MDTLDLMRTFLSVVDTDSFTRAGSKLGKSKALVSKHVSELEARLGARLLHRTTRSIGVTEIGRAYYERAQQILADFDNLEDQIRSQSGTPRGLLKLTAPQTLGEMAVMDMATAFRRKYPAVELDILLADRTVDLVAEGFDVALRVATMTDSSLIARKLCSMRIPLCASPAYLERNGTPRRPEDLVQHHCIVDSNIRWRDSWRFERNGEPLVVRSAPPSRQQRLYRARCPILHRHRLLPGFAVAGDVRAIFTLFDDMVASSMASIWSAAPPLSQGRFLDLTVRWFGSAWERVAAANIADRQLRYRLRYDDRSDVARPSSSAGRNGGLPDLGLPAIRAKIDAAPRPPPACVRDRLYGPATAPWSGFGVQYRAAGTSCAMHGGGRRRREVTSSNGEGGAFVIRTRLFLADRTGARSDHPRQPRAWPTACCSAAGDRDAGRSGHSSCNRLSHRLCRLPRQTAPHRRIQIAMISSSPERRQQPAQRGRRRGHLLDILPLASSISTDTGGPPLSGGRRCRATMRWSPAPRRPPGLAQPPYATAAGRRDRAQRRR